MSDTDTTGFGKFVPGFDFLQGVQIFGNFFFNPVFVGRH